MAYNKDNYEHQRLSPNQEEFCQQILQGKTQRQAYYIAYPRSKNWKENATDSMASKLMSNPKIKQRLLELGYRDTKKVEWTRKKALETINYVMEINRQDIERQIEGYNEELELLEGKLVQLTNDFTQANDRDRPYILQEINETNAYITKLKQKKRTNGTNVHGIYEGAKILNRMFGFDITKVEIQQADNERENMQELSVEELKQLAYSKKEN